MQSLASGFSAIVLLVTSGALIAAPSDTYRPIAQATELPIEQATVAEIMGRPKIAATPTPLCEDDEGPAVRPPFVRPRRISSEAIAATAQPVFPFTTGLSFECANESANDGGPPFDTNGSVGPAQVMVALNGVTRVFDKTTGAVGRLNAYTGQFFNGNFFLLGRGLEDLGHDLDDLRR